MKHNHRQIRITITKEVNGVKKLLTGRIVTVLRANRKYSSKYLDGLGIESYTKSMSSKCRIVLKALDGSISIIDVSPKVIDDSRIIRYNS